jgi:hypothetical protein
MDREIKRLLGAMPSMSFQRSGRQFFLHKHSALRPTEFYYVKSFIARNISMGMFGWILHTWNLRLIRVAAPTAHGGESIDIVLAFDLLGDVAA